MRRGSERKVPHTGTETRNDAAYTAGLNYLFEYKGTFGKATYTTEVFGNRLEWENILKRNGNGSIKSPAIVDEDKRALYIARDEQDHEDNAQLTNNSAATNKTPTSAISSDEEV